MITPFAIEVAKVEVDVVKAKEGVVGPKHQQRVEAHKYIQASC